MSNKVSQEPILAKEPKISTQSKKQEKSKKVVKKIVKSRRRTSLTEFATTNNLRPEVTAGFKAWLRGELFHFDEDWVTLFEQYKQR